MAFRKQIRRRGTLKSGEPNENQIQADYFDWCAKMSRTYPELEWAFHIPNGTYKSQASSRIHKVIGLKSGVPDVQLPVPSGGHPSLWIEFKTAQGRVSDTQKTWMAALKELGHAVHVCRSWTEAADVTLEYLGHPKQFNAGEKK